MWLSDRRGFLAAGLAMALAGCNFTPAYAPGAAASALDGRIFIPEPTTEDLFQIVKHFEGRMGRATEADAPMTLTVSVSKSRSSLGTTATGSSTRFHWTGTLTYTLRNAETRETIDSSAIRRFTAYSATGNIAASLAAERDATRRLMIILTDAMIDQLLTLDRTLLP